MLIATVGADLVTVLTQPTVYDLLHSNKFLDFIAATKYQGKPLADRLGGLAQAG